MRRTVLFAVLAVLFVAPGQASATSNLGYQVNGAGIADDAVTISGSDVDGFQAKYSVGCFFGCSFTVSSIIGFNDLAAQCTATVGTTEFTCDGVAGGGTDPPGRAIITGTAGNEAVEGNCFFQNLALTFTANGGDDRVTVGCTAANIDLGPGDDDAALRLASWQPGEHDVGGRETTGSWEWTMPTPSRAVRAATSFAARPGTISLDGGAGNDVVEGEDGLDTLTGGPGRDTLNGGPVTDGSPAAMARHVTYEDRAGNQPVTITLDGAANDGEAGENDAINADVEDAIGGAGDDTITGNAGANELDGGDGGDVIDGLAGRDTIDARDRQRSDHQPRRSAGIDRVR